MVSTEINTLCIEDDPNEVWLLQKKLRRIPQHPLRIEYENTLQQGLERLKKGGIEVVLLDLNLPDSSHFETFYRLHKSFPNIPVIIFSNFEDDKIAVRAVESGAQDYIIKADCDAEALLRAILYTQIRFNLNHRTDTDYHYQDSSRSTDQLQQVSYLERQLEILQKAYEEKQNELEQKNELVQTSLEQIDWEKNKIKADLFLFVENMLMPLVNNETAQENPNFQRISRILSFYLKDLSQSLGSHSKVLLNKLSPKEVQICQMIRNDMTTKEIADALGISAVTVETHRNHIRKKLGLANSKVNLSIHLKNI